MSISFLTLVCLGTAFTAVSFFVFARSPNVTKPDKKEYWRGQGKKISPSAYAFICIVAFPLLILAFAKHNEELLNVLLPALVIALLSLLRLKSSS